MAASGVSSSHFILLFVGLSFISNRAESIKYEPNWKSIDSRPLPAWYDQGKIGIFLHWGVFSVPSYSSEWFWYHWQGPQPFASVVNFMKDNYKPDFTYADFAKDFSVQEGIFNPNRWAEIFNASGARYIVQVTKHHEGFTSWPSKYSFNWNSMDVGPRRDLVAEVSSAVRKYPNLRYGVYHSLFEWFNPLYLQDRNNSFKTQDFVFGKTLPELYELVNTYKPDIVWSDGCNGPDAYWNSTNFLAWLYNESPVKETVVTNDRWGNGALCHHGGFLTCHDHYNPGTLQTRKFENAMKLDGKSWGFRRDTALKDVISIEKLLQNIAETISCNGNVLINVGPTKDGVIAPIYEERLRQMGSWLSVNGEAVYNSRPWTFQNDTVTPGVWYTQRKDLKAVYAFVFNWPSGDFTLAAPQVTAETKVTLLGYPTSLSFTGLGQKGIVIHIPPIPFNQMPCMWMWTLKITNLAN
ncbi:alpha-L-fucosidase-like [Elysia marginata]|uniref:alpha-L-fucosidase n=1 Tax=Elysia marginata TaxID=1093978 RepID=A0AAV4F3F4_9GAST|nr:alpha-L-fucosidase-like [Elysia marginata]